jgi:hypothetical protein
MLLPVAGGVILRLFASDFQGQMFVSGSSFTVTVTFADGTEALATATVP